jgi:hypothetical protein
MFDLHDMILFLAKTPGRNCLVGKHEIPTSALRSGWASAKIRSIPVYAFAPGRQARSIKSHQRPNDAMVSKRL